jgi:hypothetical protein
MQRNRFFVLAALVPGVFGAVMLFAPGAMLGHGLALPVEASTRVTTQWAGYCVLALALINFLCRNDPGSPALRAVMIGNIVFHLLGIAIDAYDISIGAINISGLVGGLVPHSLLAAGFAYYLVKLPQPGPGALPARARRGDADRALPRRAQTRLSG